MNNKKMNIITILSHFGNTLGIQDRKIKGAGFIMDLPLTFNECRCFKS